MVAQSHPTVAEAPAQQLLALCTTNGSQWLYRYDPASGAVEQARFEGFAFTNMIGLPDDSGVVMLEYGDTAVPKPSTFIWQNGRERVLQNPDLSRPLLQPLYANANGRWLLLQQVDDNAVTPYALLPLDTCLSQGACQTDTLLGLPIWSPNGEHMLNVLALNGSSKRDAGLLFTGNEQGGELAYRAEGGAAFWLNDETIAYSPNGRTVMTQPLAGGNAETLFSTLDLIAALATVDQPSAGAVIIDRVVPLPNDPDLLVVVTADPTGQAGQSFLFSYRLSTTEAALLAVLDTQRRDLERSYRLSPNGRFLAISSFDGRSWRLYLYDLLANQLQILQESTTSSQPPDQRVDWSADGQRLLLPQDGYFRLLALDGSGTERPLFVGEAYCETAVWYNG
jgi:hypothetical protein